MEKRQDNDAFRTAVWLAEHQEDFEFRTVKACVFRAQLRKWYYGKRKADQAEMLVRRFHMLFSGNFLLDALADPIWRMASCLNEGKKLLEKMDSENSEPQRDEKKADGNSGKWIEKVTELKKFPRGDIVGKKLGCYLGEDADSPEAVERRLRLDGGTAARQLKACREELFHLCTLKRISYQSAGVSAVNFVLALLLIGVLCFAVPAVLYLFLRVKAAGIQGLPMAQVAGNNATWTLVVVWTGSIVWALCLLPKCVMSVVGNLVWVLCLDRECRQDITFLRCLDRVVEEKADRYCKLLQEKLGQAEQKDRCLQEPVLEQARNWLLPEVKISWWRRSWALEPLLDALRRHIFGRRGTTIFLLLLIFCLGQLLMMHGDTLQSLVSNFS